MIYIPVYKDSMIIAEEALQYRQAVGGLLYLVGGAKPVLAFATAYMIQFNNCPSKEHWSSIQHILRHLS